MPMPIVDISVPGEEVEDVTRAIGVEKEAYDMPRVWRDTVLPWVLEFAEKMFRSEGAHGADGKWADYSGEPKYAMWKLSIVGHWDLLRWEKGGTYEMLYPSLTDTASRWNRLKMTDDTFLFGTEVPHADDVATRTTGPFGEPSPARPPLSFGRQHRTDLFREIVRDFRDHEGL